MLNGRNEPFGLTWREAIVEVDVVDDPNLMVVGGAAATASRNGLDRPRSTTALVEAPLPLTGPEETGR